MDGRVQGETLGYDDTSAALPGAPQPFEGRCRGSCHQDNSIANQQSRVPCVEIHSLAVVLTANFECLKSAIICIYQTAA